MSGQEEFEAALRAAWLEHAPTILQRVATIETAAAQQLRGTLTEESRRAAERDAHKLVGSLGTFGHSEPSEVARTIEAMLAPGRADVDAAALASAAVALRNAVEPILAPPGWRPAPPVADAAGGASAPFMRAKERVDVAIVDDDETLASLLVNAFQQRRISARWIDGAGDVLGALCGPDREVEPRVILLDVDMPGLDGLRILRVLAGDPTTAGAKVIMVTVRSSEAEVLAALRLGAIDHIAKPFSLRVLVQKVERALAQ